MFLFALMFIAPNYFYSYTNIDRNRTDFCDQYY